MIFRINTLRVFVVNVKKFNVKPKTTCLWLVRAQVRIPFAAIFADIPRGWFKLMMIRLLLFFFVIVNSLCQYEHLLSNYHFPNKLNSKSSWLILKRKWSAYTSSLHFVMIQILVWKSWDVRFLQARLVALWYHGVRFRLVALWHHGARLFGNERWFLSFLLKTNNCQVTKYHHWSSLKRQNAWIKRKLS